MEYFITAVRKLVSRDDFQNNIKCKPQRILNT